jgi:hypothetical protein
MRFRQTFLRNASAKAALANQRGARFEIHPRAEVVKEGIGLLKVVNFHFTVAGSKFLDTLRFRHK